MLYYSLPILSALLWAVSYTFLEETLDATSVATIYLFIGISTCFIAFLLPLLGGEPISMGHLSDKRPLFILLVAIVAAEIAGLATTLAIKNVNATYAAIGEISYPIFIPIIAWFLFQQNQVNFSTVCGGILVILGVAILLVGQMRHDSQAKVIDRTQFQQTNL